MFTTHLPRTTPSNNTPFTFFAHGQYRPQLKTFPSDMCRQPLDVYDIQPRPMMKYKANNGWHFNECAAKYAVSLMMKKNPVNGKTEPIEPMPAKQVDEILAKHAVKLEHSVGCDYVYVANMCKADYLGSSIIDEKHMALYIKDVIDDVDATDGTVMRQWYAKMVADGQPVPWAYFLGDEDEDSHD